MKNAVELMKDVVRSMVSILPARNIILFESVPDCCGNTKAVFDELVRRGYNRRYRLIWWLHDSNPEDHERIENVLYLRDGLNLLSRECFSKLMISENMYFYKKRKRGQYIFHMFHGAPLKHVSNYYRMPDDVDEVVSLSPYFKHLDAENNQCRESIINPLGFPRNDALYERKINPRELFPGRGFNKLIYWLPTFRQNKGGSLVHSDISIPIIHDEQLAIRVNDVAREHRVLIVVKPHFAQDVSKIKALQMSNIVFIDDVFLTSKGFLNYDLLAVSDALLTDYSSVYYDYLLTDRPIGLCWEDFDDYKEKEGFIVDTDVVMAGGEKIYTAEDLGEFIGRIGSDIDVLAEKRNEIKNLVFPQGNIHITPLVADRIEEILEKL
ncbi:MAG: CDP-glycerol glycerophosphotransferase family protein [Spirochaetales bacterium]|nr:CDP-glycerol glycerophosphotransferase family protein [Spirochaetales bacterium]